jgi:hypothetical protein
MKYQVENMPLLKNILWADTFLGGGTALIGLIWYGVLAEFLGLPDQVVVIISAVTLVYALVACRLALQTRPAAGWLRILVYANWVWTVISIGLLIYYVHNATFFGAVFLLLQVVVVGMLAWLEGRHIRPFSGDTTLPPTDQ